MSVAPEDLLPRVARALSAEYELVRPLGQGGMATVFLARERALKRLVAVKVLDPELARSPMFRIRFKREAEFAAALSHPNIVPIYRVGADDDLVWFVMAYVPGEHLGDRLKRAGRLPPAQVLRLLHDVGGALGAAHRRGLIHRDVKPQNILLEAESGRVLVTDFGIARVLARVTETDADATDPGRLTGEGMVMGTPRYMSPEQASGEQELTPASDFYALGVVGYECLTGEFPYRLGTPPNFLLAHLTQQPAPLAKHLPGLPDEVQALFEGLLRKEPGGRVGSVEALEAALAPAVAAVTGATEAMPRPKRRRRLSWPVVGAALVVLLLAGVAWRQLARERGPDPRRSMLIGFFENRTGLADLDWLRVGAVEQLAQALGRWQDLQVVHAERLLDLARRADLTDGAPLSQDDARRLGRLAGAGTVSVGSITRQTDGRIRLTVRLYDTRSGRSLHEAAVDARNDSTLADAFRVLADRVLDVSGAPQAARLTVVEPPTTRLDAYRAFVEGVAARSRWDLRAARDAFERAIAVDSGFALAWYELSRASQPLEAGTAGNRFVAYADSALARAGARPEKERLLIEGYHALVHADLPTARARYGALLAKDSTLADAWAGLGDAARLDVTLVRTPDGGERFPADLQLAVRSYQRALALDGSDHRLYQILAGTVAMAALDQDNVLPAYRDPPTGDITTLGYRRQVGQYMVLALGDSLALMPVGEAGRRFGQAAIDSLRGIARGRARAVVDQWLAVAPEEGQAHLLNAYLQRLDLDFDGALRSLDRAERLPVSNPLALPFIRLSVLLEARRFPEAGALADSLERRAGFTDSVRAVAPHLLSAMANARLAGGRVREAEDWRARAETFFLDRQRSRGAPLSPVMELRLDAARLALAATYDLLTFADVRAAELNIQRRIAAAPDSIRGVMRAEASGILLWLGAAVGDTTTIGRWRATLPPQFPGGALLALAWARAGDLATARRLYAAARRDSTRDLGHLVALARTAAELGQGDEALRYYDRVEAHRLLALRSTDTDWGMMVRSYLERARIYAARGDTRRAADFYRRFLAAWSRPEPSVAPQREAARKALEDLLKGERKG